MANLPKRTCVKEDLKRANTITEGHGTAGSQCSGKDTQDLPPRESIRAMEETLSPPVWPSQVKPGLSSIPPAEVRSDPGVPGTINS